LVDLDQTHTWRIWQIWTKLALGEPWLILTKLALGEFRLSSFWLSG
jgi:hypothetical protein